MELKISDLKEGVNKDFLLQEKLYSFSIGAESIEFTDEVKVRLSLQLENNEVLLSGTIFAPIKINCNRCLEPYNTKLNLSFNESFIKEENFNELTEEEIKDNLHPYNGDLIELDELIIQNIIFALPVKKICSENCKGLCPQCGVNLNEGKCNCNNEVIDPRLAKLKDFFKSN